MTANRLVNIALTVGLVVGIAAILSTGHLLDDHSADYPASTALQDAQRAARLAARTEQSAQALCKRVKGPNAAPRWTPDGELLCVGSHGSISVAKVAP